MRRAAQASSLKPQASLGVTLLELLVVITLLGMLSLGLLFSMRISSAAWQRGNARMASDRQVVAAAGLLSAQLANARPRVVRWTPPGAKDRSRSQTSAIALAGGRPAPGAGFGQVAFAYFEGAPERLRFLTAYSVEARARGGLWLAEYFFIREEGGACNLLYNEWPFREDSDAAATVSAAGYDPNLGRLRVDFAPPAREQQTRQLYRGLRQCHFEYLIEPEKGEPYWGAAWQTNNKLLPRAVAARFEGREAGGIAPVAVVATVPMREVLP